jgi:hypothetical protein
VSSATPSPTTRQPSLATSNEFWDLALSGKFPNHPRSLRQAIRQSDLIVVGRITGALGSELTVAIDDVLTGEPEPEQAGTVTIQVGPAINEDADYVLPLERHLFCLKYLPTWLEELGRPPEEQERAIYDYSLIDPIFGPLREFDGIARATKTRNPDYFPAMFEGDMFEDVLTRIREAIASTP